MVGRPGRLPDARQARQISVYTDIHLRYGIFVALGGSLALLLGGLRLRRDEIVAERRQKT